MKLITTCTLILILSAVTFAERKPEEESIKTSKGILKITFVGHGTLIFTFGKYVIHIDPWTKVGDYQKLPKADAVLITHAHGDHLDLKAIKAVTKKGTLIYANEAAAAKLKGAVVLKNADKMNILGIPVKAVPAYNLLHKMDNGNFWHPRGDGNGYVFTFGDKLVYVAGDTENIPEMQDLKNIDIAFLPMNVPYTMTPEMVTKAVRSFKPGAVYPYHTGDTKTSLLADLLKNDKDIRLVIKDMQVPK